MEISVFGLGYVGCVGIGCLAKQNHYCIGVDVNTNKVGQINAGKPTIIEKDIDQLISEGVEKGLVSATTDVEASIHKTTISFICVGTPNGPNGHLDLKYVYAVSEQIGLALKSKDEFHIVCIRSTVFPGTNEKVGEIIESSSGKKKNIDFAVVSNPEFLREGCAVADYFNPGLTIVGTDCLTAREKMIELYRPLNGRIEIVAVETAELIKYLNNSYHALKIAFANEVGNICKRLALDSHEVMRLFCSDTKLNISGKYFMPGFAYGGSCLPKDLKGLWALSHDHYLESPIIGSIEKSNADHKEVALKFIMEQARRKVGFLGLSFKPGTDDLRNSPAVEIVERLLGKGYEIRIYDRNVHLSNLTGTNKEEIERRIPHLNSMISDDLEDVVCRSEVVVFTYCTEEFAPLIDQHTDKIFVDLARVDPVRRSGGNYIGIAW